MNDSDSIFIAGEMIVIANGMIGISLVDVSDINSPKEICSFVN